MTRASTRGSPRSRSPRRRRRPRSPETPRPLDRLTIMCRAFMPGTFFGRGRAGSQSRYPDRLLRQLVPPHFRVALRADAVAELGLGVLADVRLDLLPVVLVVADLLAVGADRQEAAELLDAGERRLEIA